MTTSQVPQTATPPGAPRATRSTAGIVLTVAGVVVVVALLVQGVAQLLSWVFEQRSSASATLAATDVVELVTDGRVEVVAADVDDVRVDRSATYAWAAPRYEVTADGERTVVRHECPTIFLGQRCSASLTAEVPEGTRLVIRSVDGDVRVAGAVGDVELRTTDGDVTVAGAQGDVSTNGVDGDVSVDGVLGDVVLHLTDGDVIATDVGGDLRVRSLDGSTTLSGVGGDVEARMTDGRLDVRDVRGSLTAQSVDGDVQVAAVRGDMSVRTVDGDITVHGTGEPVALSVSSMGGQRIEAPTDPDADVRVDLRAVDGDVSYLAPEG